MSKQVGNISNYRKTDYEIDSIYLNRWSPRSFLDKKVPESILFSLFEAARWAPSSYNKQPWRFIYAQSEEDRQKFLQFILPGNRVWCEQVPVFVAIISEKVEADGQVNAAHAFDTGAAWGYLALEATRKGLITHAMGGIDKEKARSILHIPEEYELHAVLAVGYQGEKEDLPEDLQKREQPSDRRLVKDSCFEGEFGKMAL